MLDNTTSSVPSPSSDPFPALDNGVSNKRKRKPAGTPGPCWNQIDILRDLQPRVSKRPEPTNAQEKTQSTMEVVEERDTRGEERVYVCPEPSCLHHDPCHALGDLVGIKKHFRRKHSNHKQWVCEKCSKGYAVQSDYKAHLKTCGTRGHSCDCGRVFSRVESFIEHQDACTVRRPQPELQALQPACSSRTASSTSPSSDGNFSIAPVPRLPIPKPSEPVFLYSSSDRNDASTSSRQEHNLELQLLPSSTTRLSQNPDESYPTNLKLSIGSSSRGEKNESNQTSLDTIREKSGGDPTLEAAKLKEFANEQLRLAMAEKAYAEEARQQAKRQLDMAELEFANAKRIRQQAQAELEKAQVLREQATKKISSTIMQITCQACKQQFQAPAVAAPADETSLAMSYMSSATTEGKESDIIKFQIKLVVIIMQLG
ncbi:hypothetical protein GH714_042004 [Hevea brasiliensis]|uniref:C2H2-type domain-containing protein n=1 Tax=Hevea brasiliensis TaxID=3981 RepID=A0A6A6MWV6_HEVBR|nr:hypothetical protein GH714_042004 [Hevea brasiliensis]